MDANGVIEVKDFSRPNGNQPKPFKMEDDVFYLLPGIPVDLLVDAANLGKDLGEHSDPAEMIGRVRSLFEVVLIPDSFTRFSERLGSRTEPIDMTQIRNIIPWMLESFGLRPTAPSSASSNGSPAEDGSTSSTDGASASVLPGGIFPLTDGSTSSSDTP